MVELHTRLVGFSRLDYDKKKVRRALRQEGGEVRKISRLLVGDKGRSSSGDYPGMQSGLLRRSIRTRVLRGELAVVIEPVRSVLEKVRGADDAAYPWILAAGVAGSLVARKDYVEEALQRRSEAATEAIRGALQAALVPR